ncbi:unnamed protein product [Oppiella nova]|uniref:2-phosphoxylose phosphatase 1 n=1 Tax=Oppiella nova TaxID=334625 RepID=A0A7R9QRI1_9ACAR|nr:unnamed protein product [Oppiella nova]CAG2173034.1 unnamed protein product [Oppiella nova]
MKTLEVMRVMAVVTAFHTKRLLSAFIALILVFIALTFVTFQYMNGNIEDKSMAPVFGHSRSQTWDVFEKSSSSRISRIQTYCNPFTSIALNEELFNISAVISDLRLSQVSVVIRHGDRGPLRAVRNLSSISCDPFNAYKWTHFHSLFKSYFIETKDKLKYLSKTYAKSPKSRCELGGLTKYGCVQHLTLGSLLSQIYGNQLNISSSHVKVYSTPYTRTYQSALAFVYGFLRPKSTIDFNKFPHIITTFGTYFCMPFHVMTRDVLPSMTLKNSFLTLNIMENN